MRATETTEAYVDSLLERSTVSTLLKSGGIELLGTRACGMGARRALLVTDPGVAQAGHAQRAAQSLTNAGMDVHVFHEVRENPTTVEAQACAAAGRAFGPDLLVGLGGGSAMDCMKGANLVLSNGGEVADYRGDAPKEVLAQRSPLLPMIAIPTTAGTGSEAQSFALISDPVTREKMVCGDRRPPGQGGLRPRLAILDPDLTATVPRSVAAAVGMDALSHAVETAGCRVRNPESTVLSTAAFQLLSKSLRSSLCDPTNAAARHDMLLGAHLAGAAIERSMLGAAHACANPVTSRFGIVHGRAVGLLLPHVVRFNGCGENPYSPLGLTADALAALLEELLRETGLPTRMRDVGVAREALADLAVMAARQWTAGFNPRPAPADALKSIYDQAW